MSDEHVLGLSELHYRRVFAAAKDGILILNADTGAVEDANAFMTELLIASEMLPRIFEMFLQADHSFCRSQGGLGIGRTRVKSLVEMHGGTVEATSDGLGKGSAFTVRLSTLQPTDIVPVDATILPAATRSIPFRRILIVDDVGPAAQLVAVLLQSCGQQARIAASGAEALAMMEQEQPDLIHENSCVHHNNG